MKKLLSKGKAVEYKLIDARNRPDEYRKLFHEYCEALLDDDETIAKYDPNELADENLASEKDHPYIISTKDGRTAGLVVFMDETRDPGENDCHTYIGELFVREEFRRHGLGRKVATDYIDSLEYDTGLCFVREGYGQRFWLNLMKEKRYRYKVFREDDVRDFLHICLRKRRVVSRLRKCVKRIFDTNI